ncbi:putative Flotillin family [Helianthus anomalus]
MVECIKRLPRLTGEAVKGLRTKITIWTDAGGVGDNGDGQGGAMKEVAGLDKMLPPLFNTVHEEKIVRMNWIELI